MWWTQWTYWHAIKATVPATVHFILRVRKRERTVLQAVTWRQKKKNMLEHFTLPRWQTHKRFINSTKDTVCTRGLFCPCRGQSIYKTRSKSENRIDKKGISSRQPWDSLSQFSPSTGDPVSLLHRSPLWMTRQSPLKASRPQQSHKGRINAEVISPHVHGESRAQIDEQTHAQSRTVNPLTWTFHLHF